MNSIEVPVFTPVKTANTTSIAVGDTVTYTVSLTNTYQSPLTNVFFQDIVPDGLSFVPNSVTISGEANGRCQAITDIIESVALQETALSHILNAEGEKIQAAVAMKDITADELLQINQSATSLVNNVTRLEVILQSKLQLFSGECQN